MAAGKKEHSMHQNRMIGKAIVYLLLTLAALFVLLPLVFLVLNSFKGQSEIVRNPLALPERWTLDYIKIAVESIQFGKALVITLGITIGALIPNVIFSSLCSWIITRHQGKKSTFVYMAFVASMLVPFQVIMYPLIKSTTVTVIIFTGIGIWNDYLLPFLTLGTSSGKTLVLELYYAKMTAGQYGNPWELIFPAVLVCCIPLVVVFLCLQKYFVTGMTEGAVK